MMVPSCKCKIGNFIIIPYITIYQFSLQRRFCQSALLILVVEKCEFHFNFVK